MPRKKNRLPKTESRPAPDPCPGGPGSAGTWPRGRASPRPRSTTTWPATARRSPPSCIGWRRCAASPWNGSCPPATRCGTCPGTCRTTCRCGARRRGAGRVLRGRVPGGRGLAPVSRPTTRRRQRLRGRGPRPLHEPTLRGQGDRGMLAGQGMALGRLLRGEDRAGRVPDQADQEGERQPGAHQHRPWLRPHLVPLAEIAGIYRIVWKKER